MTTGKKILISSSVRQSNRALGAAKLLLSIVERNYFALISEAADRLLMRADWSHSLAVVAPLVDGLDDHVGTRYITGGEVSY